ncbi:MAG TPA: alpha/beta fold hydrolase [Gemmatimonadales bacterium]
MTTRRITFAGSQGQMLSGRLELPPDGDPRACALFAHCFTCSKDGRGAVYTSRALAERGIAVLRFDFTGLGESEGEFEDTTFGSNVDDLVAAADFLTSEFGAGPALLVGHSLGGAAVVRAVSRIPSARAVATVAAPAEPTHVRRLLRRGLEEIERTGVAEVELGGRVFRVSRDFVEGLDEVRMRDQIARLEAALLVLHSPADRVVGIENARMIYDAARHPKSFVSLDDADHLLSEPRDAAYAAGVIAAWAERYLPPVPEEGAEESERPTRVTVSTGREGYRTEIGVRHHTLVADEPGSVGGTDAGPTPYDLLVAALGACTTMTLQMYARRKGWPLEEAIARLRHTRGYAHDQARCEEDEDACLDSIERELELVGPLGAEQRRRLAEIADRCPVHRTVTRRIAVRTTVRGE